MKKPSAHMLATRVKTAKKRSSASTQWLQRQLNDPYVAMAKQEGYRARSAFKLIELDDKFHFLSAGKRVVDLGAAPGGWTQIAVKRVKSTPENPLVVGLDLLEMAPIAGAKTTQLDFLDDSAPDVLKEMLGGHKADVVLSDMAPNTTGMKDIDHLRIMGLLETAYAFACEILNPGGAFVAKIFQGGTEQNLLNEMKKRFKVVKHAKPPASRKESSEFYVVATGFKGEE
ncbi:MAG: RlmE family RNA methyltransferase [Alphaproteobacteria bacterium]|nr:RlmE family RNA methyltransferase [Alphaproteobacteria bacterium]MBO4643099.1 RlmE family RNA methyltransferase [Alphaproteobacteria bacterium]